METVTLAAGAAGALGAVPRKRGEHILALDGLRGIAILAVMLVHFTIGFEPASPASAVVFRLLRNGFLGVDLFFVLSGFLITGILLDQRNAPHPLRNFYARRVLRIFPLYYAYLTFLFVVAARMLTPQVADSIRSHALWLWLYASNIYEAASGHTLPFLAGITWSLGVEEQFYGAWPMIVMHVRSRQLAYVCVSVIATTFVLRLVASQWGEESPATLRLLTQRGFDALMLGGLAALSVRAASFERILTWVSRSLPLTTPLALATLFRVRVDESPTALSIVFYTVFLVWIASVLLIAVTARPGHPLARVLQAPLLRSCGKYSYGMYLLHAPIHTFVGYSHGFGIAARFARIPSPLLAALLYACVSIALSYGAARLSWFAFESRFLAMKRYFEYERPAVASPQ